MDSERLTLAMLHALPPAKSAIISPCGTYRYRLERAAAGDGPVVAVIMVNPSTADANRDDATIRKLRGFAKYNGWRRLIVGNLFAFRATDVRELAGAINPVGFENDLHLESIFRDADRVIFAWGPLAKQPKYLRGRSWAINRLARDCGHVPMCIGEPTKDGQPRHPLMLPYHSPIRAWKPSIPAAAWA